MTEPGLPRPPSIASLPKDPSEVKGNTSQDASDKERRSGGTVPEADDKAELDNQDHEISGWCRFHDILIHFTDRIGNHQIERLPRRRPTDISSTT